MSLPNMSGVLSVWSQSVLLKTITTTTVDFVQSQSVVSEVVQAVIQPAKQELLMVGIIDRSLRYIQVHTTSQMAVGQYVEYGSTDYKIVQLLQYGDYGYYEAIAEEVKGNLI